MLSIKPVGSTVAPLILSPHGGQKGELESACAGAVLTKMDGDSRGGAALSVKAVSGKPIKFVGTGEKLESLEVFYPDRIASRILGVHCSQCVPLTFCPSRFQYRQRLVSLNEGARPARFCSTIKESSCAS